jgi:putative transposase
MAMVSLLLSINTALETNETLDKYLYPKDNETRMDRGLALFQKANKTICENPDGSFFVPSQTVEEIAYSVKLIERKYSCNCPDFTQRHEEIGICKHIHAVKFWIASQTFLKNEPKPRVFSDDSIQCDKCGSIRVIRYGIVAHKQAYWCKDCNHKFLPSLIKKSRFTPELVCLTLDMYFSGTSLRDIARIVSNHTGFHLGATTIYDWIQKFVPKISEFVNSLSPQLSDTWHADELFVKMKHGIDYEVRGKKYEKIAFLWNVMDRKTRYLLASKLSPYRDGDGATRAFKTARDNARGQEPEQIFTDALKSYKQGADYAWTDPATEPKLIQNAGINKPHATNNRIERMNGTLRSRVKTQRGWKSMESQIAEGQRIHYNFVKPHQALEGMPPAQRAGIQTKGWNELLEQALKKD